MIKRKTKVKKSKTQSKPATLNKRVLKRVFNDSWGNVLNKSGIPGRDPGASTTMQHGDILGEDELSGLWENDALCRNIVEFLVDDALKKGIEISEDDEKEIQTQFERLNFIPELKKLLVYSRVYGGAGMVLGLDDGTDDSVLPIDLRSLRDVKWIKVYNRYRIRVVEYEKDMNSQRYLMPKLYDIYPLVSGSSFRVHYSRIILADGDDCSEMTRTNNENWGISSLQGLYEKLSKIGLSFNAVAQILNYYVQDVVHITNLHGLVVSGKSSMVRQRMSLIDESKNTINCLLLDKEESFERNIAGMSGISEVLDRLMIYIAGAAKYPVTRLWGRSAAGENATGEGDQENYFDSVASYQTFKVKPVVEQFTEILFNCSDVFASEPDNWRVSFEPLKQMSQKEKAEIYKINSEADNINIQSGALSAESVNNHRYSGELYNENAPANDETTEFTDIDKDRDPADKDEPVE